MTGRIVAVYGNMVIAETQGQVVKNSVGYCCRRDGARLLSEVIRIRGRLADLQVFEETRGLRVGDDVEFRPDMLSVVLGPGLLGQIYDGLQNPLPQVAEKEGFHLTPGVYIHGLPTDTKWAFTPTAEAGQAIRAGETLGTVPEGIFTHHVMAPFGLQGEHKLATLAGEGEYTVQDEIATLTDEKGEKVSVTMEQPWPVKVPLNVSRRRLMPTEPLVTQVRIIDSMFPIVRGGTYCIPGPFGAGKTVLQQITSRYAMVDVVILAACGERAGEVVETIREFPELIDPRTGRSLMERTIIICNTSAMPVAAREASVYTAATLGEYYRQMGLNVLLLADSTSRWAQAMRELSGRLEEIPGEEAFPAYLESRIAGFYERAGLLELHDGRIGSLTIGGTVSPAGGNFEEPVTQGTLKVVGAFHGLSRARSDARRYPAIDPLDSWSKYAGIIEPEKVAKVRSLLRRGSEVRQMMTVVGEEGTSMGDFLVAMKADFFDSVYLQQNAFDKVDAATSAARQKFVFDKVLEVIAIEFDFDSKDTARRTLVEISDLFRNWNYAPLHAENAPPAGEAEAAAPQAEETLDLDRASEDFKSILADIEKFIARHQGGAAEATPSGEPAMSAAGGAGGSEQEPDE
ncbi:MAG TPA: V-type ATP synthase subunit A [Phycisphaerae bacterium]|nr:V-type ATP synthase subunit A [Phycisphaerae bacterium]